ncbi:MAG: hypothetical protein HUJ77_04125 [Clostridium sp.]|uniref:hypothetical protein n=1 Tax=Clostridium sp. TaxID=1506 RepID=UPI0025C4BF4E|nr:hypothetical protein [Clostridium sp.]MCF0147566.1 hypothetical protein [Clostridium sp.]
MNKKKREFQWQKVILIILFMIIGGVSGFLIAKYVDSTNSGGETPLKVFINTFIIILLIYIAIILQIIIHEAGHLIGGLISGYKFSSFRVFNIMLIKENGSFKFKKLSLAGTGGQCLMIPPELIDGKVPYKLYNLGGSILNIITALIFLSFYILVSDVKFLSFFFLMISIIGIAFAIMNGVPMKFGGINNDGDNALSLGKNSSALKSFWIQMKINELASKGVRMKDMPEELFIIPSDEEMKNSIIATIFVFSCNRLMDENKFEDAHKLIRKYLDIDTAIVGLHRSLLICDEIYCKAINGSSKEEIDLLLDKGQKKFMKAMKKFPSVLRTEYVYSLIIEKDLDKASKIRKEFNKISLTYPYQSDIESEYELIEIAEKILNK